MRIHRCYSILVLLLFWPLEVIAQGSNAANQRQLAAPSTGNVVLAQPTLPANRSLDSEECHALRERSAEQIKAFQYEAVIDTLKSAVPVCSNTVEVRVELARAEMLSRHFEDADKTVQELLTSYFENVEALITAGQLAYLENNDARAEMLLQRAVSDAPVDARPLYELGRVYYAEQQQAPAERSFVQALKTEPAYYKAYDGLALVYAAEGEPEKAQKAFMDGLAHVYQSQPQYDTIYADFAEFLIQRESDPQQAFNLAAEAARRNPGVPRNFYLAGKAAEQAGHLEVAIRWLNQAGKMDSSYPEPHFVLARIYRRLHKDEDAHREIGLFIKLHAAAPAVRR